MLRISRQLGRQVARLSTQSRPRPSCVLSTAASASAFTSASASSSPVFTASALRRTVTTSTSPHHAAAISVIKSNVDTGSDEFCENRQRMGEAVARLEDLTHRVQQGGPPKARQKHRERGKMLPRHRVRELIDPGTTFLELSPLAGHELYPEADVPSGGIITGVGVVEGVTCVIVANDSTVKGGTYYPITVKKHLRAQEVAEQNHLP